MKFLFYFGHPAQYLFVRETIKQLSAAHQVTILIKTKDVLEDLIREDGLPYTNILSKPRGSTHWMIILSYLKRLLVIIPIILRNRFTLLIGTDATIAQLGKVFGINRITILEDDYEVIKSLAQITYPLTQTILCPEVCQVGPWTSKKVGYKGYMKLGYLHPAVFKPDPQTPAKYQLSNPYVLIRLARLTAYHDVGKRGIDLALLKRIISLVEAKGYAVKISSEDGLGEYFKDYILRPDPRDMHHLLAHSALLICDSQSMSVEAAMLGVPSIRYSDFSGKISVLEELEHTYQLTYGILPGRETELLSRISEVMERSANDFLQRRNRMLNEKINVTPFLVWFLENYPASVKTLKANPAYQDRFIVHAVAEV
ncbi:hypothetical protein GCM10027347_53700 [Larkinella harenae]